MGWINSLKHSLKLAKTLINIFDKFFSLTTFIFKLCLYNIFNKIYKKYRLWKRLNTNNNENNKEKLNDQEKNIMIADDLSYNIINSAKTKNKDNNDYLKVNKYKNIKKENNIYINDIIVLS